MVYDVFYLAKRKYSRKFSEYAKIILTSLLGCTKDYVICLDIIVNRHHKHKHIYHGPETKNEVLSLYE